MKDKDARKVLELLLKALSDSDSFEEFKLKVESNLWDEISGRITDES